MAEYCDLRDYQDAFRGVVPIYRPAGRARGRIFAFHGPGGGWESTWTHDHQSSTQAVHRKSTFWLRDLLPEKFPHCAIYSIGHENALYTGSDVAHNMDLTHKRIIDHLGRTPLQERAPIVLIAHGFGGVYLKDVIGLVWGPEGHLRSCTPDLDRLIGTIFLGTPHRFNQGPSHYESFFQGVSFFQGGRFVEGSASALFQEQTWSIRSGKLNSITEDFRKLVKSSQIKIVSAVETQPANEAPVILKSEAELGDLPNGLETIVDGAATHFALSKFLDCGDQRFVDMCRWLDSVLGPLLSKDCEWEKVLLSLHPKQPFEDILVIPTRDLDLDRPNVGAITVVPTDAPCSQGFWMHFPYNDESLMKGAMRSLSPSFGIPDSLGTVLRARSDFPHSRYVLPNVELHQSEQKWEAKQAEVRTTHLRIFLPYLHWDTVASAKAYNKDVSRASSHPESEDPINLVNSALAGVLKPPLKAYHPRRTMDQYYYSRMKDTTRRDNDQVVSRQTGLQEEGIFAIKEVPSPPSDGPKMIMVDQLWLSLWVVEQRKLLPGGRERWSLLSSAVLTSFPHTSYPRSRSGFPSLYRTADVRQKVLERLEQYEDEGTYRACSLVSSILSASILGTLSVRQDWSLDFLELFREAIGEAAEKQDNFFRNFDRSMRSGRKPLGVEQRREEIKLGLELADIVDELNMLRQLLDTQMDVLRKAIDKLYEILLDGTYCVDVIHTEMKRIRAELMDVHSLQINRMLDDSERVQKRLMDLLDLQQKEQNIYEAQRANQQALFTAKHALSAEDQADATNAQSQILFIFTLVTIVFLPLSFITSYFGLFNVNNPEGGNVNYGRSYVDTVMGAASGVMTTAFLVGAVAWYYWSKKQSADQRAKELQKYEDNGDLPPGLIFDDSQDRQRMDKFNPRHVDRAKTSKPVVDEKENEAVWPVESSLDRLISRIGKRGLKPEDEGNQQEQV